MIRVWLDDIRNPKDYGYHDATWFKSYAEWWGFNDLNERRFDLVEEVHLDHDLGEENTGYDALIDIECMLTIDMWKSLKKIYIHTSNPSAGDKMMLAENSLAKFGVKMIRKHY